MKPLWLALLAALLWGEAAEAHTVIELYNPYYLVGAAVAVVLSFVVISLFVSASFREGGAVRRRGLSRERLRGLFVDSKVVALLRCLAVLTLLLIVLTGLFGSQIETWNLTPLFLSTAVWVLIPAIQILLGNVWAVVNPWTVAFEWGVRAHALPRAPRFRYPEWLASWPAVGLLFLATVAPSIVPDFHRPRLLSQLIVAYCLLTWTAMSVYGKNVWLHNGEVLTVFYDLVASMSPTGLRVVDPVVCNECSLCRSANGECVDCEDCFARARAAEVHVRPYGRGLLAQRARGPDRLVFVLLLLAAGMYGGLAETRMWSTLGLRAESVVGAWPAVGTVAGVAAIFVLVAALYFACCVLIGLIAGPRRTWEVALAFVPSLIPVAVVFHFVHSLDRIVENTQLLFRLLSDPFGFGWNVLGTRTTPLHHLDVFVLWHAQVALVVAAHVVAVYVAHCRALALYQDYKVAIKSQIPMLTLMVLYTVAGLWILSTIPIVVGD